MPTLSLEFICSLVLGLILGSFLSMLIPRLHDNKKGIVSGRSECPHCHHTLGASDLIPLLSYLFLKGRCHFCKKVIPAWYPLIELSSALLFGAAFLFIQSLPDFLLFTPILFTLLFIFFYDLRYKEIHDMVVLPAILYAALLAYQSNTFMSSLQGAGFSIAFFGLQYGISKGRWIGSGDILIGIFLGLSLGLEKTLLGILLGYILGSIVGLALIATHKASGQTALPLGPFLVLGTLLSYFYGAQLLDFYWNL